MVGAGDVMRQIVLDTETTGLEPEQGHRVIEIGAVELVDRRFTERRFHCYLNPDRDIEPGALEVHGLTEAFLHDKPRFADIARDFMEFVAGAELVIHNAAFDVAFLNAELARLPPPGPGRIEDHCAVIDTLALARSTHPGQRNGLDALCARYGVDNSQRVLHGALLDAEILADVYLAMTGGQASLLLADPAHNAGDGPGGHWVLPTDRPRLAVLVAAPEERERHLARLRRIDDLTNGGCVWLAMSDDHQASEDVFCDLSH
jgi:DNA polymerase III subunit epsilon